MVALEIVPENLEKVIYNSRNLMVALEEYIIGKELSSTTVEILWWL